MCRVWVADRVREPVHVGAVGLDVEAMCRESMRRDLHGEDAIRVRVGVRVRVRVMVMGRAMARVRARVRVGVGVRVRVI